MSLMGFLGSFRARFFRVYPVVSVFIALFQSATMFYLALRDGAHWVWFAFPVGGFVVFLVLLFEFGGGYEAEYSNYFRHTPEQVEMLEMSLVPVYRGAWSFSELYDFMIKKGFYLFDLNEVFRGKDSQLLQVDGLFVRRS